MSQIRYSWTAKVARSWADVKKAFHARKCAVTSGVAFSCTAQLYMGVFSSENLVKNHCIPPSASPLQLYLAPACFSRRDLEGGYSLRLGTIVHSHFSLATMLKRRKNHKALEEAAATTNSCLVLGCPRYHFEGNLCRK